jgi:hypothetical protein
MESVNLFIKENIEKIAKKGIYIVPNIPEKKLNNILTAFKCENSRNNILAIYDNSLLGNAKEGLVFTGERILYNNGELFEFKYKDMKEFKYIRNVLVNNKGKEEVEHYILIKDNHKEFKLEKLGNFNYQAFEEIMNKVLSFKEYKEEDQFKPLESMTEDLKVSYIKIIINMTYVDDNKVDQKELAEILLLMTRLKLSRDSRFNLRTYISELSKDNLSSVEDLLNIIQENSEASLYESIIVSLVKDLVNTYISSKFNYNIVDKNENSEKFNDYLKKFSFLEDNKHLLNISDDKIKFAIEAVRVDYENLYNDLDDESIKKNFKELTAKAAAVGSPLAAIYMSGSVVGMSAAGITSGLAALGLGIGMTGGLAVVSIIGVLTYKGVRHFTGGSELEKYKTRELMIHEVLKQTQKTISLIIDDINYIVEKLNEAVLTQDKQNNKIEKLVLLVSRFQAAFKEVDIKNNQGNNLSSKLSCPREIDEKRLFILTNEPIKKPLYDLIIKNYDHDTYKIKDNIDTDTLDDMNKILTALDYFSDSSILKCKTSERIDKVKGIINETKLFKK